MSNQGFLSGLRTGAQNAQNTGAGVFSRFRNSNFVQGSKDFLSSNSLVAKVAFLILVVIGFVFLLRLGASFLTWLFSPSQNPNEAKVGKPVLMIC